MTLVALDTLKIAPENVRRTSPRMIRGLADDISAHGLLQNLVGYRQGKTNFICAGGRRVRALRLLRQRGDIAAKYKVPVDIRAKEEALELSLAENSAREEMHPADAIEAYGALIAGGMEPDDIAARFGVSRAHVKRILKLSGLHENIRAALADDEITMGAAMAYTLTDDLERQLEVFGECGDSEHRIRQMLTDEKVKLSSGLFGVVSIEEYRAAGGTVTQDLFDGENDGYADNSSILFELVEGKLAAMGEAAESDGWAKVEVSTHRPENYYQLRTMREEGRAEPSPKTRARLDALAKAEDDVLAKDPDAQSYNNDRLRDTAQERLAIEDELRFFTDEQKASGSLLIFLGHDGSLERTAIDGRKQERKSADGKPEPKPDYSAKLVGTMARIKTLAVREAVSQCSVLASDILLFTLARQILFGGYSSDLPVAIVTKDKAMEVDEALMTKADIAPIDDRLAAFATSLNPETLFADIVALDIADKQSLLALLVAHQIQDINLDWGEASGHLAAFAERGRVDMRTSWQPDKGFFARLTKPVMLKILKEQCGEAAAENCKRMKKADLAADMPKRLEGKGWMPEPVLFAEIDSADDAPVDGGDDVGEHPAEQDSDEPPFEKEVAPDSEEGAALLAEANRIAAEAGLNGAGDSAH